MNHGSPDFEKINPENSSQRQNRTPFQRGGLRLVGAVCAALAISACDLLQDEDAIVQTCIGAKYNSQFVKELKIIGYEGPEDINLRVAAYNRAACQTPESPIKVPTLSSRIEYLNGDGAWVVSEGNEMTVSKNGLEVTVSCAPEGVAFSTKAQGLSDSKSYWLTVIAPVLGAVPGREDIVSTGIGNQGIRVNFAGKYGTIGGEGDGKPKEILSGKSYSFNVYETSFAERKPNSGFPVAQVSVLTPDRCSQ